jgi:hypothetical protein
MHFLYIEYMKHMKIFENFKNNNLLIIDVQKSFSKFFTDEYVENLKKYADTFTNVYQVWDNHKYSKSKENSYLYNNNPIIPVNGDLYNFGEKLLIEKRYTYDVDADFFKKILSKETYDEMKSKEGSNTIGDKYYTKYGTVLVYTDNKHQFFHVPKRLYNLFKELMNQEVIVTGGAGKECLHDIKIAGESLGVIMIENPDYIYSA